LSEELYRTACLINALTAEEGMTKPINWCPERVAEPAHKALPAAVLLVSFIGNNSSFLVFAPLVKSLALVTPPCPANEFTSWTA
jgi:hypothetical protein